MENGYASVSKREAVFHSFWMFVSIMTTKNLHRNDAEFPLHVTQIRTSILHIFFHSTKPEHQFFSINSYLSNSFLLQRKILFWRNWKIGEQKEEEEAKRKQLHVIDREIIGPSNMRFQIVFKRFTHTMLATCDMLALKIHFITNWKVRRIKTLTWLNHSAEWRMQNEYNGLKIFFENYVTFDAACQTIVTYCVHVEINHFNWIYLFNRISNIFVSFFRIVFGSRPVPKNLKIRISFWNSMGFNLYRVRVSLWFILWQWNKSL